MAQGKSRRIARVEIVNNGSAPDVDSDFNTEIRENALAYVTDLYGHDKVSNIITFGTLAAKGAVKAMCNIYNIPFSQANKIAALVPAPIEGRDCSLAEIYDPDSERYDEAAEFRAATSTPEWEPIIAGARNIEGRNKSTGVHACGIVISAKPLHDVIPLQVRQEDGRVVSQWTYPELEEMGLIKMDFLGLDTVDLIQHSVEYIRQSGKTPPNMMHLVHGDMDDPATLKLFQDGNTIGIFQFGSEMVRNLLKSMKPTTFNDLSACTAVARPGPMNMLSHVKYADRKNGREEVDFIHPAFKGTPMEDILGDTFGLCVPKGTLVLNSTTGLYQPIETMVPGTMTPSYNHATGQMEPKAVANLIHTGVKDTVRIRLNGNRELHLSTTHPVLTDRGYVAAGELTLDDRVQMSECEEVRPTNSVATLTHDQAYFIGAMLGDGSITGHNQPYITTSDEGIVSEMSRIAEQFQGIAVRVTSRVRDGAPYTNVVTFHSGLVGSGHKAQANRITQWLGEQGYPGRITMYDKKVSDTTMGNANEILREVVAGLWDTDGTVSREVVHFTTTSPQLHLSMGQMLTRLGVGFGVSQTPYTNATRKDQVAYRTYPVFKDFAEKVQPWLRHQGKKNAHLGRTTVSHQGRTKFLNHALEDFNAWAGRIHPDLTQNGPLGWKAAMGMLNRHYGFSVSTRNELIDALEELDVLSHETIRLLSSRYRSIVSIDPAAPEDCYDIEVEDNHNFVVSGAIVHNCVYQEQIIRIASDIAGMTLQEGDDLRKAMGKKKMKVMMAMRPKFFDGAMANGYPEEAVTTLWDTIAEFAKYGFNKSHSVAYAMNSYQTAWLKTHYPVEFMAALIAQNVGDKKKTLSFLREAKRMGISVGTVDVNLSSERVAPDFARTSGKDILFGLGGVSNVSADAARIVVKERGENGPFRSVQDFVNRCMPLGLVNRKVIESLAMAGAFDSFGVSRRSVVEEATKLMGGVKTKVAQGNSLFDDFEDAEDPTEIPLDGPEYPHTLKLQHEADMVGLYLTGHPLEHTGRFGNGTTIAKLLKSSRNVTVSTVASIIEIEKKSSRNGGKSYILSIDDGTDYMTARLSPEMVRSLDKYTAQQAIRKAYEEGDVEVAREFRSLALNPEVAPQEELALNTVYTMEVSFRPGKGDNPYNARITAMRPLVLADDGRLPVRLRFRVKGDNEAQMRTLLTALPRNLGQKLPGPYPIHVALHGNLRRVSTRQDNIYQAALDEMDLDLSQGRHPRAEVHARQEAEAQEAQNQVTLGGGTGQKKGRNRTKKGTGPLRSWPPATGETMVPLAQSPADIAEAVETLNYHNSGFTTAKTQAVVNAIEKYLPAENYDFGIFDPSILD